MSKEEIRTITIQPEDLELARITKNLEVRLQTTISENDIQKFCKGCDFLSKDNLCKKMVLITKVGRLLEDVVD